MTQANNNAMIKLGLDLGTSGFRAAIVQNNQLLAEFSAPLCLSNKSNNPPSHCAEQQPVDWLHAFDMVFDQLQQAGWTAKINQIIANATSSTVLLTNTQGKPLTAALMYDDNRAQHQAEQIKHTTDQTSVQGATSTLAKVMWLAETVRPRAIIQHQIDWLNFQLCGVLGVTDENNALKLGYDSVHQAWPNAIRALCPLELPTVVAPGSVLGSVRHQLVERWGFNPQCSVHAGTTDSIAAFLASGANQIGDAVSALGSTIAIKTLSDKPVFAAEYGIYSHKLHDKWLVGGASNAGGAVLLHYFSIEEIQALMPKLDIHQPTGLDCYPLTRPGERFPTADSTYAPRIPQNVSRTTLLQALIEGLVDVEKQAYLKLQQLGAPKVKRIFAVGGGGNNQAWSQVRQRELPAEIAIAKSQSAAYGVTRLLDFSH